MTDRVFNMSEYFAQLTKIISWRDPSFIGTRIIHAKAKKPNYVIFRGIVEESLIQYVKVYIPNTKEEVMFQRDNSWYIWQDYDKVMNPVAKDDTDLINAIIEGINTLILENGVKSPESIKEQVGGITFNIIMDSHRKEDIHVDREISE